MVQRSAPLPGDRAVDQEREASLSVPLQLGFGVGQVGGSIIANTPAMILLFFMTDTLQIPPALAGLAVFIPKAWVILFDPIMGRISDHSRSRWGRRRPFILWGAIACGIGFYFLFDVPWLATPTGRAAYMTLLFGLVSTAFSIFSVPYLAMAAELAPTYRSRTHIMVYRITFQAIGILIGIGLARYLVEWGGGGRQGYTFMGAVMAIICLASMLSPFVATRGRQTETGPAPTAVLGEQLRTAAQNRPYLILASATVLYWIAASCVYAGLPYLFSYIIQGSGVLLFNHVLFMTVASIFALPVWGWIGNQIGKRPAYVISTLLYCATVLTWLAAKPEQDALVIGRGVLIGLTNTGLLLMAVAMLPDTIEYDSRRTGLRREGIFSGVWMAIEKAGNAAGALVVGVILSLMGFVESAGGAVVQTDRALFGILVAFAIVPVVLMLVSLLIMSRYSLTEDKLAALSRG
jgi:GPH family glycoside/pentoside/hexuronide:cation symporter